MSDYKTRLRCGLSQQALDIYRQDKQGPYFHQALFAEMLGIKIWCIFHGNPTIGITGLPTTNTRALVSILICIAPCSENIWAFLCSRSCRPFLSRRAAPPK